jgi:hypothetical protein
MNSYYKTKPTGKFKQCSELGLIASPAELRSLAEFLLHCAKGIERSAGTFGHAHYKDFIKEPNQLPDLVISYPDAQKAP